jgi:hypothetical protein
VDAGCHENRILILLKQADKLAGLKAMDVAQFQEELGTLVHQVAGVGLWQSL